MNKKNARNDVIDLGKRFRELRRILNKTQNEMSEELGITQANMSQIESGKCLPNFSFHAKLAEKFPQINFNWLLYGDGAPIRADEISKIISENKKEVLKKIEKSYLENVSKLEKEIDRLKSDNSKLISAITKKKR